MARSLRIQYPGAVYHVMARGNRREPIFLDEDDRRFFLKTLSEACERTGWLVHAWVLMGNHYHLCIETPEPNLVEGMKWLQNTLTRRFNVRHRMWGRVFGDRYKAIIVQTDAGGYMGTLVDYIHLNPVRAGLVRTGQGLGLLDYQWSSLASGYAVPPKRRAPWLRVEVGLAQQRLSDTTAHRRVYVEGLEARAKAEDPATCGIPPESGSVDRRRSDLRRGWYWGTQEFAEKLIKMVAEALPKNASRGQRRTALRMDHGERTAKEWLREGASAAEFSLEELIELKSTDPRKGALATMVWGGTTVSLGWIAEALQMKSAANAGQIIRRYKASDPLPKIGAKLKAYIKSKARF